MTLVPIDATSELAVSDYLTKCRDWLATCVEMTGPEQIAAAKAEIATAAEATKQLGLSKEIQLDAQEMVRRAEYALGKAIRKGQSEGEVRRQGQRNSDGDKYRDLPSPTDFAPKKDLDANGSGIYHLSDGVGPQTFDDAIERAKAEGNLSRANVARKIIGKSDHPAEPAPAGTTERAHQEAELINAFGSIVRRSLTPKNVATLTPKAKRRLISILNDALNTLQETSS